MTFVILFDEDYGTIHVQQHSNVHVERYISLHVHTLLLLSNYTLFTAVFPLLQKHAAPNPDLCFYPNHELANDLAELKNPLEAFFFWILPAYNNDKS